MKLRLQLVPIAFLLAANAIQAQEKRDYNPPDKFLERFHFENSNGEKLKEARDRVFERTTREAERMRDFADRARSAFEGRALERDLGHTHYDFGQNNRSTFDLFDLLHLTQMNPFSGMEMPNELAIRNPRTGNIARSLPDIGIVIGPSSWAGGTPIKSGEVSVGDNQSGFFNGRSVDLVVANDVETEGDSRIENGSLADIERPQNAIEITLDHDLIEAAERDRQGAEREARPNGPRTMISLSDATDPTESAGPDSSILGINHDGQSRLALDFGQHAFGAIKGLGCAVTTAPGRWIEQAKEVFDAASTITGAVTGNEDDKAKIKQTFDHLQRVQLATADALVILAGPPSDFPNELAEKWKSERTNLIAAIFGKTEELRRRFEAMSPEEQSQAISEFVMGVGLDMGSGNALSELVKMAKMPAAALAAGKITRRAEQATEAIEEVALVSRGLRRVATEAADDLNAEAIKRGLRPSWKPGTIVRTYKFDNPTRWYRVRTIDQRKLSEWVIHKNPTTIPPGLTREAYWEQLRKEFSIPPGNKMSEVVSFEIPANERVRIGIAGEARNPIDPSDSWGTGGGLQYEILDWDRIKQLPLEVERLWP